MRSILYKDKKFTHILHISDIHIRLFKRYDEYKQVFNKLYRDFSEWCETHTTAEPCIVVAGDIFHSKLDLSPESILLASELFKNLSKIAPTIVIPGNHDLLLNNKNRLDSLSPVIDNLNLPYLHYLKTSGIYKFGNIDFVHFSILGDKKDWPKIGDWDNEYNVGLFHGSVYNSETDVGYKILDKTVMVDNFDGLDVVVMGDIHRFQILQKYNSLLKKPTVAFSSSAVQQNHGELLHGHGWLEWTLLDRQCQFHELKNDYGYATVELGKTFPTLPKNVRLRIFSNNESADEIQSTISQIRKNHNILELSINNLSNASRIFNKDELLKLLDVRDVNYQNQAISSFISQKFPDVSPESIKRVLDLNVRLNSKLLDNDLPKNVNWKPLQLKFDNLFSFGSGNIINFNEMNGLYGLFAPNRSGKTSTFSALCFALFDRAPNASRGIHIMNTREADCYCELTFQIGDSVYKIERRGKRKKTGEVKIDVDFSKQLPTGDWELLNGNERKDTNSIIRSYVGSYDDFILTNLSVQNQNSLFIEKGQADRKDLLSQFMGLSIFDKLHEIAGDESREISGALKQLYKDEHQENLENIDSTLAILTKDNKELCNIQQSLKNELDICNERIVEVSSQKLPVDIKSVDRDALFRRIGNGETASKTVETEIQKLKGNIEETQKVIVKIEDFIKSVDDGKLKKDVEELSVLLSVQSKAEQLISITSDVISDLQHKISLLKDHKYNPDCEFCVNNEIVKNAKEAVKSYDQKVEQLETYNNKYLELTTKIKTLTDSKTQYEVLQKQTKLLLDETRQKTEFQSKLEEKQETLVKYQKGVEDLKLELKKYDENETAILHNSKLDDELSKLYANKKHVETKNISNQNAILEISGKIKVLTSKRDEIIKKINQIKELQDSFNDYDYYQVATSRDGIPYSLICEIVPTIQQSVNHMLGQIVDFTISLELDGKNVNGYIVYNDSMKWPLELGSGMEKFISGLAIRVALMSVSSLPRSNFLVVDEGFGVLDSSTLSSVPALLSVLLNEFEFVVLISHLDTARDFADKFLEISQEDGYSRIVVT